MILGVHGRRGFSQGGLKADKLSKVFNQAPWNFNAHLMQRDVASLEAPVDLGSAIFNSVQATTLFKEFVSGIYEDDLSYIKE